MIIFKGWCRSFPHPKITSWNLAVGLLSRLVILVLLFGRPLHPIAWRGHRPTLSFFFFNKSTEASTLLSSVASNRAAAQRESLCDFSAVFLSTKAGFEARSSYISGKPSPRKTQPGLHDGTEDSSDAPQQRRARLWDRAEPFRAEFARFPCDCVDSLRVLRLAPTIQRHANVRLIGYSEPSTGVIVSLNSCLSLYGWIQCHYIWMDGWTDG